MVQESGWIEGGSEEEEGGEAGWRREWGVRVSLAGLSVSLVSKAPPAELVHALFDGVLLELALGPSQLALALCVTHMQWDNQVRAHHIKSLNRPLDACVRAAS